MPQKPKPLPSVGILSALFVYDPVTGHLTNRVSRTSRRAGSRAEHVGPRGYAQVYADGALRQAHRIAWVMHYGVEPPGYIDHINGNPLDNRIENLRVCSHPENMLNQRMRSDNKTGCKGVTIRENGAYRAGITVDGKRRDLGTYSSFDQAKAAAEQARVALHGEFARSA